MRKNKLLDALFTETKQRILLALLGGRRLYLSDLAHECKTTPSTLQRDLKKLTEAGILIRTANGNRTYYEANKECPIYSDLKGLISKTSGLHSLVASALAPFMNDIRLAFVYGSIAKGRENSASDVDLLLVSPLTLRFLTPTLAELETNLEREVNVSIFSEAELLARIQAQNNFVLTVLASPVDYIIGSEDELAEIIGFRPSSTSFNEQERSRRAS